ncbi:MAG TPA: glycosyltransferase family 39 protein [Thermodesulfobacteriota bacterium]|nr:glycosyltransferase family 39 protein [Thermodesulfobacteriota bacterium]
MSIFFYSLNITFDRDEFEHIHTAWKMANGQRIYVDFFQHHHPFFDYMLIPVIRAYGSTIDTLFVGRYVMLVLTACILAVTYALAVKIFKSREVGVIGLILTSAFTAFYMKSIEIRPDVPEALTGLLAVYFLFTYYDNRSSLSLIASALSLAISLLFLQKALELILPIGGVLLYDVIKKRVPIRDAAIYAGAFVAALAPYYAYLLLDGSFVIYYEMNWLVNLYIPQLFGKLGSLSVLVQENTVTFVLYFVGAVSLIRSGREWRFAVLSLCLLLLPMVMFKNLWRQYFLLAIPPVAIIAGYAIHSMFNTRLSRLIVILGAIYIPLSFMHNHGFFKMNSDKQTAQLDKVRYVLSITKEGDKVYDGSALFNIYRDDIDYFWFCVSYPYCLSAYQRIADYPYDIYELIDREKPKVISDTGINSFDDIRIKNKYRASDRYPDLHIRAD